MYLLFPCSKVNILHIFSRKNATVIFVIFCTCNYKKNERARLFIIFFFKVWLLYVYMCMSSLNVCKYLAKKPNNEGEESAKLE